MMTGLLHPTEGEILFNGRNIRTDNIEFKHRLGYVPEEPNLYGNLTGLEYLQLAGGLRGPPLRPCDEESQRTPSTFSR